MTSIDYIAICDPVAVQKLGHNLAALARYSIYLARRCSHIEIFAGASLFDSNIDPGEFHGKLSYHYSHYYSRIIHAPPSKLDKPGQALRTLQGHEAHEIAKKAAIDDLEHILNKARSYVNPIIYFPSIDYYSLLALASLREEIKSGPARIFIRFIGVMENACHYESKGEELDSLLRKIALAAKEATNKSYFFTAESPPLARRMQIEYGLDMSVTPTLVDEERLPEIRSSTFTLCFPGSARLDKGFDRISNILLEIDRNYPSLSYEVYLQALPVSELVHHYNIQRDLFRHPRVRAYPATVSQEELKAYIQKSRIMVLPYCPNIYKERSSAMMAEAACYGRQVVASSGCGFSTQLEDLGIGISCSSNREIAKAIANYSLLGADSLASLTRDASINYRNTLAQSYEEFFSFSS